MATNGASTESYKAKEAIVYALCKRYSIDSPISSEGILGDDIKTLVSHISKLSAEGTLKNEEEVMKWVAFADNFLVDLGARAEVLKGLNDELILKSVLVGGGLNSSEADIAVYAALHSFVNGLSSAERQNYPNVLRWADYIQNKEDFSNTLQKIQLEKIEFEFPVLKDVGKVESDTNPKKGAQNTKATDKPEAVPDSKKSDKQEANAKPKKSETEEKLPKGAKATDEKKASSDTSASKDSETSVSLLNIKVGLIIKAWKHPSADSLLVEEIDVGEGSVRQVVSGLAKYCTPEELTNRRVVLITNVKPGKLRDVTSAGLVLCASSKDQTAVEPLLPPEGAKIGERILISGHDEKPEDVLNPKKKQLDKITPYLSTDDKGIATFKGIPFMTSAGPCTSSIPNGTVK